MEIFCGKLVLLDCESEIGPAVIYSKEGKITKVEKGPFDVAKLHKNGNKVNDFGDLLVMPGLVDSHVHVNEPGRTEWEGFATATQAAAAAGITAIVDMPLNSIPPTTTVENFEKKLTAAKGKCFIDVAFWGGVIPGNEYELKPLLERGVKGFKCFLLESGVSEFPCVSIDEAHKALKELQGTQGVLLYHAELDIPPASLPGDLNTLNKYVTFLESRPPIMEDAAIKHIIALCEDTQVPCHIVHLATGNAIRALEDAQNAGLPISVESCHHYLNLTSDKIPDANAEFKCCPPIREKWHREQLWNGIKRGVISMVVSDHSPSTPDLKTVSKGSSLMSAWGGISSLQFGLPLMWTEAKKRGFNLQDIVKLLSRNPAKLAKLDHCKSALKPGYDADFVVWDPLKEVKISKSGILYKNKLSPYDGWKVQGMIHKTFVRGQLVYSNGQIVCKNPVGIFLL